MIRLNKKKALFFISMFLFLIGVTLTYTNAMANESFLEEAWGSQCGAYYPCGGSGNCGDIGVGPDDCRLIEHETECTGSCESACDEGAEDEECKQTSDTRGCQVYGSPDCSEVMDYECKWIDQAAPTCRCKNATGTGTWCTHQTCE